LCSLPLSLLHLYFYLPPFFLYSSYYSSLLDCLPIFYLFLLIFPYLFSLFLPKTFLTSCLNLYSSYPLRLFSTRPLFVLPCCPLTVSSPSSLPVLHCPPLPLPIFFYLILASVPRSCSSPSLSISRARPI
jgi:hypothetical protein